MPNKNAHEFYRPSVSIFGRQRPAIVYRVPCGNSGLSISRPQAVLQFRNARRCKRVDIKVWPEMTFQIQHTHTMPFFVEMPQARRVLTQSLAHVPSIGLLLTSGCCIVCSQLLIGSCFETLCIGEIQVKKSYKFNQQVALGSTPTTLNRRPQPTLSAHPNAMIYFQEADSNSLGVWERLSAVAVYCAFCMIFWYRLMQLLQYIFAKFHGQLERDNGVFSSVYETQLRRAGTPPN